MAIGIYLDHAIGNTHHVDIASNAGNHSARQIMKNMPAIIMALAALLPVGAAHARTDALCKPLRAFAASIESDGNRSIEFHTSWGSNFKNSPEPAVFAKRCLHNDYKTAKVVCDYLMAYGSAEFPNRNVTRTITCLFPETHFDSLLTLNRIDASFTYDKGNGDSIINISFGESAIDGGMVLKINAQGY